VETAIEERAEFHLPEGIKWEEKHYPEAFT
jgi:hypothetical protein